MGSLWGARLLTIQTRKEGRLELDTDDVVRQADVLTNVPAVHALTAWRRYNDGAVVEQRIEELAQLSAGKTAAADLGGSALLWSLAVVAYKPCIRYANTCSRAPGGWPSRSGCASGCSGFPRS